MAGRAGHRGWGNIRKLPSGRYQASYIGPDLSRHAAPTTFEDKDTAVVWLSRERVLIASDDWTPPKQRTQHRRRDSFATYSAAWLTQRRVRGQPLRPRTRGHYQELLDRLILPTFGPVTVRHITPESVVAWYDTLGPATPTQNAHAYALLRSVLATAVDQRILAYNPCTIRGAGSTRRAREVRPATLDELAALVTAMPAKYQLAVLLSCWCALRFGEVTELRRKDIDLKAGVIRVRRAVTWIDSKPVVGRPKSDAGSRDVAIPPHLMPAIKAHLREHAGIELLFPSPQGIQLTTSTLYASWWPARRKAGRPDLRWHDLRHTGATLAAQSGATLAELMSRLGHSTPGAALIYQHAAAHRDTEIAALLSKLAAGK